MNKIGLLGGLSYVSTLFYYEKINLAVNKTQGSQHSANLVIVSPDFNIFCEALAKQDWATIQEILINSINELDSLDCNLIGICCNTIHHVFDSLKERQKAKVLHILDPTIQKIKERSIKKVGLLATKNTLSSKPYCDYITDKGLTLIRLEETLIEKINHVIFQEMCHGHLTESGKSIMRLANDTLMAKGCEGIILGCTELGLFLKKEEFGEHLFDSSLLHAEKIALEYMDQSKKPNGKWA